MDELNPTIKERQIYHEMKLTPAMVKSIRTLCGVCLRHYVETKAFKIAIVPNKDRCMETCTVCHIRMEVRTWNRIGSSNAETSIL